MTARKRVQFAVGWDAAQVCLTEGVLLREHIEGFPRVILGRHTMLGDLGGVNMKWDTHSQTARV